MNAFNNLFSGSFAEALGWTLIHSLWQIAAVAIVIGGVMIILQNKSARLRYYVALSGLFSVSLFSVITFLSVYQPNSIGSQAQVTDQLSITQLIFSSSTAESNWVTSFNRILSFLQQNLSVIVGIWVLGVLFLTIRFAAGLAYITKLKNKGHLRVPAHWKSKFNKLANRVQLNKQVQLFESVWVKVPTVVGYIKPLVLVPIGTFAALPVNQLEAILAHELAHIKRNDYLINIFQSVVEIIYFFHPGIWWMSHIVRKERELCCDDLALECGCDSLTLARALANIEELSHQSTHELAMAINGKGSLLSRIKRLIGQREESTSVFNGVSGAVILLIAAMITLTLNTSEVFSSDKKANKCSHPVNPTSFRSGSLVSLISARDSIKLNNKVKIDDKDVVVIIKDRKGEVTELRVNGKVIPKEKWTTEELQSAMNERMPVPPTPTALPDLPAPPTPPNAPQAPMAPEGITPVPPTPPMPAVPPIPPCNKMKDMKMKNSKEWKKFNAEMEKFGKEMEKWQKDYEPGMKDYEKKLEVWQKENAPKFEEFGKQMETWEKENGPKMEQFGKEMEKWASANEPQIKAWAKQLADNYEVGDHDFKFNFSTDRNDVLENELIEDKLIKSGKNYSFSISGKKKELIINGVKQSKEMFEKYDRLMKDSTPDTDSDYEISISKKAK